VKGLPEKSRSRARLGADAARIWARELCLGNPYAKSILLALANYMNEDGSAFPGISTIARDTDISEDTVVSRLRWLESIGAIALFKCWADEHGRRNYDGRGRQTSSEIRFLFDADVEAIEAAAKGSSKPIVLRGAAAQSHAAKGEVGPRPQRELNEIREQGVGPGVAPEQPPTAAARTEYPITDSPQSPPLPDEGQAPLAETNLQSTEGIPYEKFTEAYGEGSVRPQRARALWDALTSDERDTAIRGARGYRVQRLASKKSLIDPERFLRDRVLWMEFAGSPSASVTELVTVDADADDGRAWRVLHRIAGLPMSQPVEKSGRSLLYLKAAVAPAVMALLRAPPEREWGIVAPGDQSFGAWRDFINAHTGKQPIQSQHIVGQKDGPPDKEGKPTFAGYLHQSGIKIPAPFPPRVDGSWPEIPNQLSKKG
jgi:hypothetical protein